MDQWDLIRISKFLPRLYVGALLGGIYAGFNGFAQWDIPVFLLESPSMLTSLAFPAYGILFGMLWLGLGPLLALFLAGLKDGLAIKSYLAAGGAIYFAEAYVEESKGALLLGLSVGLVESLSFLYAATGGMYLAIYLTEVYRNGAAAEETRRTNFARKTMESLFLALMAIGLRLALY